MGKIWPCVNTDHKQNSGGPLILGHICIALCHVDHDMLYILQAALDFHYYVMKYEVVPHPVYPLEIAVYFEVVVPGGAAVGNFVENFLVYKDLPASLLLDSYADPPSCTQAQTLCPFEAYMNFAWLLDYMIVEEEYIVLVYMKVYYTSP